jgi:hypothetical protein
MVKNEPYNTNRFTVIDNRTGEEYTGRTFTIKVDEDPFAYDALEAYASAAEKAGGFEVLVADLDGILMELEHTN